MKTISVKQALLGEVAVGSEVVVRGWIRTKRDSKAGVSFLAVNDGSAFDSLQVVVPNTLSNYADAVVKLTTGCSVICKGTLVQSQGKGQSVEVQGT